MYRTMPSLSWEELGAEMSLPDYMAVLGTGTPVGGRPKPLYWLQ